MTIIDLHDQLSSIGNSYLCLFRNDTLGAALSICYNVSLSDPKNGKLPSVPVDLAVDSADMKKVERKMLSRSSIVELSGDPLNYLEKALTMLVKKIMCVGVGLQEYYCVAAIIGLLKKRLLPEQSKNEEHASAEKVSRMIQRVLQSQDNYSAAATLASLPNMVCTPRLDNSCSLMLRV